MKRIFKLLGNLFISLLVFILHLCLIIILPYPFNLVNIIVAYFTLRIAFNSLDNLLIVFFITFCLELFVSSAFGIVTVSFLLTVFLILFIESYLFTNHSLISIFFASLISVFFFRVIYYFLNYIFTTGFNLGASALSNIFIEAIFTSLATTLIFLVSKFFFKKTRPTYVIQKFKL